MGAAPAKHPPTHMDEDGEDLDDIVQNDLDDTLRGTERSQPIDEYMRNDAEVRLVGPHNLGARSPLERLAEARGLPGMSAPDAPPRIPVRIADGPERKGVRTGEEAWRAFAADYYAKMVFSEAPNVSLYASEEDEYRHH